MRTTRLALPWSASVMLIGVLASGCATTAPSTQDGLSVDPGVARFTGAEQRERADSARAQMVADEVGPRVTVSADFDYAGGSRQVDARFHMYDDAYVIVGHLDAQGRLKVVFPSQPGDDGFVRGDKIYNVPSFFAGFADEYAWRYSDYRYRYHSVASRNDSYDAGLGYVFVIASWRPMRLDRIADGNRWQTYDVSDISYMSDPREAIEELGSVIAGDNREAYTIEYAHYTTTNYGMYSYSDFDAANSGCFGNFGFLGFAPHSLFSPFGFYSGYGFGLASSGCGSPYSSYSYFPTLAYGYPVGRPFVSGPPRLRPPLGTPAGTPIYRRPQWVGIIPTHRPEPTSATSSAPMGPAKVSGLSVYHRPGLVAEDAAAPRGQGRSVDNTAQLRGVADRPSIQDMIGTRRIDDDARTMGTREDGSWSGRQPMSSARGMTNGASQDAGRVYRGQGARSAEGTRSSPNYGERPSSAPRSQPSPHVERSAPRPQPSHAAPPRAEPARPAPASSSSGAKKP